MKSPFEIVLWAIAFGFAWIMFTSITGLDDAFRRFFGKKRDTTDVAAKIDDLERRVAQLEKQKSEVLPAG